MAKNSVHLTGFDKLTKEQLSVIHNFTDMLVRDVDVVKYNCSCSNREDNLTIPILILKKYPHSGLFKLTDKSQYDDQTKSIKLDICPDIMIAVIEFMLDNSRKINMDNLSCGCGSNVEKEIKKLLYMPNIILDKYRGYSIYFFKNDHPIVGYPMFSVDKYPSSNLYKIINENIKNECKMINIICCCTIFENIKDYFIDSKKIKLDIICDICSSEKTKIEYVKYMIDVIKKYYQFDDIYDFDFLEKTYDICEYVELVNYIYGYERYKLAAIKPGYDPKYASYYRILTTHEKDIASVGGYSMYGVYNTGILNDIMKQIPEEQIIYDEYNKNVPPVYMFKPGVSELVSSAYEREGWYVLETHDNLNVLIKE